MKIPNMVKRDYNYIYGPVSSWRLGSSLGIDLISRKDKICPFDCIYCQLGRTKVFSKKRIEYVSAAKIIDEIESLPLLEIDYITFSGVGEPTLAKNLGQMIKAVKKIRKEKIAILTNSSLMDREDVQMDLSLADFVVAKIDASSQDSLVKVNRPMKTIRFDVIVEAIKWFRVNYKGKLALQSMFIEENKKYEEEIARIVKVISPDEVQINTPLRPCSVKPLSKQEIFKIKEDFVVKFEPTPGEKRIDVISVYDSKKHKEVGPISNENTLKRRGKI